MSYAERLAGLSTIWKETPPSEGMSLVAPGSYQAKVEKARLTEIRRGQFAGQLGLSLTLRILGGPEEGRAVTKFFRLQDEMSIGFLKADLDKLGLDTNFDSSDLEKKLEQIINMVCEIAVVHTDQNGRRFQNVYINRLVDSPGGWSDQGEPKKKRSRPKGSKRKKKEPDPEPPSKPEKEEEDEDDWDDDDEWE